MYLRRDIVSKKQLLGQILLKRGMITKEQLQYALDCQKKEGGVLGETLIKLGYVTEQDIVVALIVQCGLPYIAVNKYEIDRKVIDIIPANIARRFHIVPLDRVGDVLSVVMANPLDSTMIGEVEQITGCKVATFIATKTEIDEAIERWYSTKE
jgi:type IV pilus assembly protein PilB